MKTLLTAALVVLSLGIAFQDAEAAKRFGGGGNLGKQRATPTQREAPKEAPTATPAQPAPAAPAAAPAVAPKPSFMSRWGGLLAGLGIGALLASLFGAQLGPIVGLLLAGLLAVGVLALLYRLFAGRKEPPVAPRPVQYAGVGSATEPRIAMPPIGSAIRTQEQPRNAIDIPGFEAEPFERVAKTSFIRLQAANDAKDLDDIRDYTTPEMYAEIAMQLKERGDEPQKTEVVSVDAKVIEAVVEDGYEIASVRFWGLMRDAPNANPESFDEIWHVRRKAGSKAPWLIAGIQQNQ